MVPAVEQRAHPAADELLHDLAESRVERDPLGRAGDADDVITA